MSSWHYTVLGLSALLLIWLVYREASRPDRRRVGMRIAAVILSVAALACIALPLTYQRTSQPSGTAILLTEGFDPDSVNSFRQRTDAKPYMRGDSSVGSIHVFGYGLTKEEWKAFDSLPVPLVFHPSRLAAGFRSVEWPQRLSPGQPLTIRGQIISTDSQVLVVRLMGFGTVLDSARAGDTGFSLRITPPHTGRAVYRLLLLHGKDTIEQEAIPVEVMKAPSLHILVLAASPDFENRFLADWLRESGHALAIRTTISKGKYDKAWLNIPQMGLDHLNADMLDHFDLVMADAAELSALPASELAALHKQIAEKGLGMVVKADSGKAATGPGNLALQRDSLGRVVISKSLYGTGRIVTTTVENTYPLLLSGNRLAYAAHWSGIFGNAARPDSAKSCWHFYPSRPRIHEATRVLLQYHTDDLIHGQLNNSVVYFDQDPILPFYRQADFWPDRSGWQSAATTAADSSWWYAWDEDDWPVAARSERLDATQRRMSTVRTANAHPIRQERAPVSRGLIYCCLLACCIFLWVERKI